MTISRTKKFFTTAAVVALTAVSAAACSSDNNGSTDPSNDGPPKPVASITALTGDSTAVKLDAGFTDALASLKLEAGTVGDGELTDGSLVFPITGGNVEVFNKGEVSPYVIGQVQHVGSGFSLTAGDTEVEITDLNVDPGVSRVYGNVRVNGEPAVESAYIFTLNGSTLKPLATEGDTAVLEGTQVSISPVAATLLNDTFKTDAVKAGLLVGIAKITVNAKSGDQGN